LFFEEENFIGLNCDVGWLGAGHHRGRMESLIRVVQALRLPCGASIEQKKPLLGANRPYSLNRLDVLQCVKNSTRPS